jgi:hypothetical protein
MVSTWTRPCGVGFTAHSGEISANSNIGNTELVKNGLDRGEGGAAMQKKVCY